MNWKNIETLPEKTNTGFPGSSYGAKMEQEQKDTEILQLKRFQDPTNDPERQSILFLLTLFGNLFTAHNISDTIDSIFTDDCEFFRDDPSARTSAKYCLNPKDLPSLFLGIQIQERIVRETYIDREKMTAIQFCYLKTLYQGETDPIDSVVAEVFTIKNNKISKYRAFFGQKIPANGQSDPFEITRKDRILAMAQQLNYALADQPDFKKVATMLHENCKYKIWSWDSRKCFVFGKHDFVESFKNMQDNLVIKSIVPYEIYTEAQAVVGTYVYHLEGVADKYVGKKYVWLCTCYYMFDDDYKITQVGQQGELHLEGDAQISFEVYPREKLIKKVGSLFAAGPTIDLFYSDVFALNCRSYMFGREEAGCVRGATLIDITAEMKKTGPDPDEKIEMKSSESYFDYSDCSYDVLIFIHHLVKRKPSSLDLVEINELIFTMYEFEHGKIAKLYAFHTYLPNL